MKRILKQIKTAVPETAVMIQATQSLIFHTWQEEEFTIIRRDRELSRPMFWRVSRHGTEFMKEGEAWQPATLAQVEYLKSHNLITEEQPND